MRTGRAPPPPRPSSKSEVKSGVSDSLPASSGERPVAAATKSSSSVSAKQPETLLGISADAQSSAGEAAAEVIASDVEPEEAEHSGVTSSAGTLASGARPRELLKTIPITDREDLAVGDDELNGPLTDRVPEEASLDWDDVPPPGATASSRANDPRIGTLINDRYVIEEIIGEGGMGRVYRAHHKVIGKQVAIKVLHADLAKDKEAVGRFVREAQAASSIGNPHIVDVSDFGELREGSTYFVMEYLDGPTLGDLIEKQSPLATQLLCDIAIQMCDGLAAAHAQQIVHRDLKPENVTLIERGERSNFCKIVDFGIAKVSGTSSTTKLTMAGAVFGTPHYMSPEQAAGASVDHRTDIYSLGVMLYEMAAGELPFNADNFMGILTQHMYKAPVPLRLLMNGQQCPLGLEAIILKCLTKKADGRYQSMEELGDELRRFVATGQAGAVEEMMGRSGSFNVPADYFNTGTHPAVLAAATGAFDAQAVPRRSRWLVAGGLVAVLGLGIGGYAMTQADPVDTVPSSVPVVPDSAPTAAAAPTVTATATAAPAVAKRSVLLWAKPSNAVAVLDGKELTLPETIEVTEGEKLTVEVKADGYKARSVELDGTEPKVEIVLEPQVRRYPRQPAPTRPPKGVVDPWSKN